MKDTLHNKIKDQDVKILTLTSGRVLIGQCIRSDADGLYISCPLEIKKISSDDGFFADKMIPFATGNSSESCIVYHHCIECTCETSIEVRQRYVESLISDRLISLMTSEFQKEIENLDSSSSELDLPEHSESDEEIWNSFLDRWKNTDV